MICEYCGAELSAGDISVIPDKNGEYHYHVICHACDKTQSSNVIVSNIGNTFYVFRRVNPHAYYYSSVSKGGDTDYNHT